MNNVDFLLPVYIEHPDRLRNLNIILSYLKKIGAQNVFVNEHYRDRPKITTLIDNYISKDITSIGYFNKMECGNKLFDTFSKSKIVCLYDVDVLVTKKDIQQSIKMLESDYDFINPFDGQFYDIPEDIVEQLQFNLEINIDLNKCKLLCPFMHGGCVMFKRDVFINGGKLNPNFKNVGFDDDEINIRFTKLGYNKGRTTSPLLHLTHHRSETSYNYNKFNDNNSAEAVKLEKMTKQEILEYISRGYK